MLGNSQPPAWGDGGGGSGASASWEEVRAAGTGGRCSPIDARKLIADELGNWIGRQELVTKQLKQQQDHSLGQVRDCLESSLACHCRTMERILVWYLDPQKAHGEKFSQHTEDTGNATLSVSRSSSWKATPASPSYPIPSRASPPAEPAPEIVVPGATQAFAKEFDVSSSIKSVFSQEQDVMREKGTNSAQSGSLNDEQKMEMAESGSPAKSASVASRRQSNKKCPSRKVPTHDNVAVDKSAEKRDRWNIDKALSLESIRSEHSRAGANPVEVDTKRGSVGFTKADSTKRGSSLQCGSQNFTGYGRFSNELLEMATSGRSMSMTLGGHGKGRTDNTSHLSDRAADESSSTQPNDWAQLCPVEHIESDHIKEKANCELALVDAEGPSHDGVHEDMQNDTLRQLHTFRKDDVRQGTVTFEEAGTSRSKDSHVKIHPTGTGSSEASDKSKFTSIAPSENSGVLETGAEPRLDRSGRRKTRRFSALEAELRQKNLTVNRFDNSMILEESSMGSTDTPRWRTCLETIVQHTYFDTLFALLISSNALIIGFQVNHQARTLSQTEPMFYVVVDLFYCTVFVIEWTMRMLMVGCSKFFNGPNRAWNWLDTLVVTMHVMENTFALSQLDQSTTFKNFLVVGRLSRVTRIIRVARIIRVMRFFRAFRILLTMIFGTIKNILWATLLLAMIMYIFGIIFTAATADYKINEEPHADNSPNALGQIPSDVLKWYYGTVPRSVFTLFKSVIGGVDWQDVVVPLSDVGSIYVFLFLLYTIFVQLAVMNVVTGFFLQNAIEQAEQDQEHVIQLQLTQKAQFVQRLYALFEELDSSHDGTISLHEFESHLKNEHMQALIQTFEIDNADAWTLFKLLDTDGGGSVDITEFVDGCIRLKGGAKSIQIAQMMYHHKWIMDKLVDLAETLRPVSRMAHNQKLMMRFIAKNYWCGDGNGDDRMSFNIAGMKVARVSDKSICDDEDGEDDDEDSATISFFEAHS